MSKGAFACEYCGEIHELRYWASRCCDALSNDLDDDDDFTRSVN
jgi:hypothetical protein